MTTMLNADRLGERVGPIEGGLVARRAADVVLQRPPRIEEQLPSQLDARGRRGRAGDAERLRQRVEECLRLLEKTRVVLRTELLEAYDKKYPAQQQDNGQGPPHHAPPVRSSPPWRRSY